MSFHGIFVAFEICREFTDRMECTKLYEVV
jgi:hypothetical protein